MSMASTRDIEEMPMFIGKVVKVVRKRLAYDGQISGIEVVFTDGTVLDVSGHAYPDGTAALDID